MSLEEGFIGMMLIGTGFDDWMAKARGECVQEEDGPDPCLALESLGPGRRIYLGRFVFELEKIRKFDTGNGLH